MNHSYCSAHGAAHTQKYEAEEQKRLDKKAKTWGKDHIASLNDEYTYVDNDGTSEMTRGEDGYMQKVHQSRFSPFKLMGEHFQMQKCHMPADLPAVQSAQL